MLSSEFYAVFSHPLGNHLLRDNKFHSVCNGIDGTLAHIIMAYVKRDAALRQMVAIYAAHIGTLTLVEQREMHLRNDGEAAILIDYAYERIDCSSLVYMPTLVACLAEAECTLTQTLCVAHYPHIFMLQILRLKHWQLTPATLREIHPEWLCIERDFIDSGYSITADCDAGIYFSAQK